jgi:hypothetical protein
VCLALSFCWWACEESKEVGSPPVVVLRDGERPSSTAEASSGGEKEEHKGAASVMAAGSEEGALVASALRNAPAILAGIYRSAPAQRITAAA